MAAIVTEHFRRNNVLSFLNDIEDTDNNYYLGIGKSEKWGDDEASPELIIPIPTGTYAEENDTLSNLISCIKINRSNGSLVIPNVKFSVGAKYKAYSPIDPDCFYPTTGDESDVINPCYATIGNRIYLCLANNDGAPSANSPGSNSSDYRAIKNTDGYVWVLIDNSPGEFNTSQFIDITPVNPATGLFVNIKNAGGGLLYGFSVKAGGIGYTNINTVNFTPTQLQPDGSLLALTPLVCSITKNDAGTITGVFLPVLYDYTAATAKNIIGGTFDFIGGTGVSIVPNIAPLNGFAYEPSRVLPAWYAGISIDVVDNISNDGFYIPYRQISIIKNLEITPDTVGTDTLGALRYLILPTQPSVTTSVGDIIAFSNDTTQAYFDTYAFVDGEHRVYFHQNNETGYGIVPDNGTFTNTSSPSTEIAYSSVNEGEYVQQSGDVVFTENRKAITRQVGQTEEIKIIIQF
jgi:hypothetical protein